MKTFYKYQGAGNDFIIVEDFEKSFPKDQIIRLCHRNLGVGADGFILAQKSKIADFKMVYFNADASEAFCGNGLRCFAHFLLDLGHKKNEFVIEASNEVLTVKTNQSTISTFLRKPSSIQEMILNDTKIYWVDTGAPHVVVFAKNFELAKSIRHHEKFAPNGVNVNFVEVTGEGLKVRTFEKGVEKETMACGTGAAACFFVARELELCGDRTNVITRSQHTLKLSLGEEIELIGPSKKVFVGQIEI